MLSLKNLKIGQSQVVAALYMKQRKNLIGFSHVKTMWANIFASVNTNHEIKDADNFDYYKLNAAKLAALRLELSRKQHYGSLQANDEDRLTILNRITWLDATPSELQSALKDPVLSPLIKHQRLDRAKALKILTTDLKIPIGEIEKLFGAMPAQLATDEVKIGNSVLYFPEGAKPANIINLTKLVATVYEELKSKGLAKLFTHPIRFVKSFGNKLGTYSIADKDIKIAYTASNEERTQFTVLHEYGHKYHREFMPASEQAALREKWLELRKAGSTYSDSDAAKTNKEQLEKLLTHLKVGDVLISNTRKFSGEWTVSYIGRDGTVKLVQHDLSSDLSTMSLKKRSISGPALYFLSEEKWTSRNPDVAAIMKYSPATQKHQLENTDAWFPTKYSETKPEEWFAELFALYISGKLKGEVATFMQGLIK